MTKSEVTSSGWFARLTRNLRFPQLFLLIVALFIVDMMVPDIVPFVDEIILGLLALVLGNLKKRTRSERDEKIVTGDS